MAEFLVIVAAFAIFIVAVGLFQDSVAVGRTSNRRFRRSMDAFLFWLCFGVLTSLPLFIIGDEGGSREDFNASYVSLSSTLNDRKNVERRFILDMIK
jgi:hypothetical protein